ncbi:MAG: hypothetical protein IT373_30570 [Polyangiaceae bacterium]|nr:hypothetical protein [Polyangiaceae bacterium]
MFEPRAFRAPRVLVGALLLALAALAGCAAPLQHGDRGTIAIDQAAFARRFAAWCRLTDGGGAPGICVGDAGWE